MRKLICAATLLSLAFWLGCGGDKKESSVDNTSSQVARADRSTDDVSSSETNGDSRSEDRDKRSASRGDTSDTGDTVGLEERNRGNRASNRGNSRGKASSNSRDGDISEEERDANREMRNPPPVKLVPAFPGAPGEAGFAKNDLIPEIEGRDLEGVSFKLSDYKGKVIMLDFWGDW